MEDEDESRVLRGLLSRAWRGGAPSVLGVQVVGESRQRLVWAGAGVQEGGPRSLGGPGWLAEHAVQTAGTRLRHHCCCSTSNPRGEDDSGGGSGGVKNGLMA